MKCQDFLLSGMCKTSGDFQEIISQHTAVTLISNNPDIPAPNVQAISSKETARMVFPADRSFSLCSGCTSQNHNP